MMSKKFIKIMCIVLAALMALSAVAVLTQVFAVSPAVNPNTGVDDINPIYLAVGAALCFVIIVLCIVLPKVKKKEDNNQKDIKEEDL